MGDSGQMDSPRAARGDMQYGVRGDMDTSGVWGDSNGPGVVADGPGHTDG